MRHTRSAGPAPCHLDRILRTLQQRGTEGATGKELLQVDGKYLDALQKLRKQGHCITSEPAHLPAPNHSCKRYFLVQEPEPPTMRISKGNCHILISDNHRHYAPYIEEHFDTYFNQVEPEQLPSSDMLLCDFSHEHCHRYIDGPILRITSLPEEREMLAAYLRHAPARCELAFDLGAYCGLTTMGLAKRFDRVIAFEPDTANFKCLAVNLAVYYIDNVILRQEAVSALTGPISFYHDHSPGSRIAKSDYKRGTIAPVPAMSLLGCFVTFGQPDFIKMDIEGAELEVLQASQVMLTSCDHLSIAIDTHHTANPTANTAAVVELLKSCGYSTEAAKVSGYWTVWAWKGGA